MHQSAAELADILRHCIPVNKQQQPGSKQNLMQQRLQDYTKALSQCTMRELGEYNSRPSKGYKTKPSCQAPRAASSRYGLFGKGTEIQQPAGLGPIDQHQ